MYNPQDGFWNIKQYGKHNVNTKIYQHVYINLYYIFDVLHHKRN